MSPNEVEVKESIYARNEEIAAEQNARFTAGGVFALNVMGAPGVGKTSAILRLIERLDIPCAVIEGDIESDLDTRKLRERGIPTQQIDTHGACHLDSPLIRDAAEALPMKSGVLFIENIGNLVCPAEFMIGEHAKMLLLSVAEGGDKPYKYPLAFEKADVILLGKQDLAPYVDFDDDFFERGVRALNPTALIFRVCAKTGDGFGEAADWLRERAKSVIGG